ncbi:MAG: tyrosine--tRNA ligase [Synergistaceae bacterium]|nr:tyrosine--tRNA ligase [Synergistaceae bacterium]
MFQNAYEVFEKRGCVEWCSNPERLAEVFRSEMVTAYVGFDPTADSLHVGHLIPLMGLAWLQKLGHRPIAIAGGGTGLIGDPSGKSKERNLLTLEVMANNIENVKKQLAHLLDFDCGANSALLINNYDWLSKIPFLDFLRDVGKYFSINGLLSREYIRSRIDDPEKGISYTEFSYVLLQSYDFAHLFKEYNCRLQMGGNDQQGNLLSGVDYIRRTTGGEAFGLTQPLLLTSSGGKFGKTEEGAVWLDPARTSPYRFYQFWINTEDADAERLLKLFTFLPLGEINDIAAEHKRNPENRAAQKILAHEVTKLLHSEAVAKTVERASEMLFGGAETSVKCSELDEEMLTILSKEVPYAKIACEIPCQVTEALSASGACESKGEAKRLIKQGGVTLNDAKITDEGAKIEREFLLHGKYIFARLGKKKFHLIEIN